MRHYNKGVAHLNGRHGTLTSWNNDTGSFSVTLDNNEEGAGHEDVVVAVKPKNIVYTIGTCE